MTGLPTKIQAYVYRDNVPDHGEVIRVMGHAFDHGDKSSMWVREDLVEALIKAVKEYSFNNTDELLDNVAKAIQDIGEGSQ